MAADEETETELMSGLADEIRSKFMQTIETSWCTCDGAKQVDHELMMAAIRTDMDIEEPRCKFCLAVTGIGAMNRLAELQERRKRGEDPKK